jgi:hypothetical protein
MRRLNITEKGGKIVFARYLGIGSVCLAVLCTMQGMVEDAYEVVVLVGGACGSCFGGHCFSSSRLSPGPDK